MKISKKIGHDRLNLNITDGTKFCKVLISRRGLQVKQAGMPALASEIVATFKTAYYTEGRSNGEILEILVAQATKYGSQAGA